MRVGDPPDQAFDAFAEREPYFAVLTADQYLRANLTPEREEEFFASGAELVDWIFHIIEHRISPHFSPMSMLEYRLRAGTAGGCAGGPARIGHGDRSIARDGWRRDTLRPDGAAGNTSSFRRRPSCSRPGAGSTSICCVHVLQRLSPAEGLALIGRLLERLATGGVAVFHVPFATTAAPGVRAARWLREHVPAANGAINIARGKRWRDPLIPTHIYHMDAVLRTLAKDRRAGGARGVPAHGGLVERVRVRRGAPLPSTTGVDERGRPLPGTALRVRPGEEWTGRST